MKFRLFRSRRFWAATLPVSMAIAVACGGAVATAPAAQEEITGGVTPTSLIQQAEDKDVKVAIENCPMYFSSDEWPSGKNLAISPAIWRGCFASSPRRSWPCWSTTWPTPFSRNCSKRTHHALPWVSRLDRRTSCGGDTVRILPSKS